MADTVDLKKLKVSELKQELKDRGLPVSGSKTELIKRLGDALGASDVDSQDDSALEDKMDEILKDDTPVQHRAPKQPEKPIPPAAKVAAPPVVSSNGTGETKPPKPAQTADSTQNAQAAHAPLPTLTAEERLKKRAEKFGVLNPDLKKQMRAERFGTGNAENTVIGSTGNANLNDEEKERLKKRAERFGTVLSTSLSKADEEERKRKRAERFGITSTTTSSLGKSVISINSSDPDLEAKKKKRAERFGLTT